MHIRTLIKHDTYLFDSNFCFFFPFSHFRRYLPAPKAPTVEKWPPRRKRPKPGARPRPWCRFPRGPLESSSTTRKDCIQFWPPLASGLWPPCCNISSPRRVAAASWPKRRQHRLRGWADPRPGRGCYYAPTIKPSAKWKYSRNNFQ